MAKRACVYRGNCSRDIIAVYHGKPEPTFICGYHEMRFGVPAGNGRDYVGRQVTLDGKPAIIAGRRNRFATVAQCNEGGKWNGLAAEFSWEAVARIVELNAGIFHS